MCIKQLGLSKLIPIQMRESNDNDTIQQYADLLEGSDKWPFDTNCIVYTDGESHWLADGIHRLEGSRKAIKPNVQCEVRKGTIEDAQDYALAANKDHGRRRTREDLRHAIGEALKLERWASKTNRVIADHIGTTHKTVNSVRSEMESSGEIPQSKSLEGKDGRKVNRRVGKSTSKESGNQLEVTKPERDPQPRPTIVDHAATVDPEEPEWKKLKAGILATARAQMRSLDDLQDVKRSAQHPDALQKIQGFIKALEAWNK